MMMFRASGSEFPDACIGMVAYVLSAPAKIRVQEGLGVVEDASPDDWTSALLQVRDGRDRDAFARLFRHFAPRIKAFLRRGGMGDAQAEDCVQDVMATLWNKAHLYDPTRATVATWIFTIARNRRIDMLRRVRPEPEDLPWGQEPEPDQADAFALRQEAQRLGEAIAQLPDAQRSLIERAFFGEVSHSEIAAETGLPLGTIKSRIRLALDRLRQRLN